MYKPLMELPMAGLGQIPESIFEIKRKALLAQAEQLKTNFGIFGDIWLAAKGLFSPQMRENMASFITKSSELQRESIDLIKKSMDEMVDWKGKLIENIITADHLQDKEASRKLKEFYNNMIPWQAESLESIRIAVNKALEGYTLIITQTLPQLPQIGLRSDYARAKTVYENRIKDSWNAMTKAETKLIKAYPTYGSIVAREIKPITISGMGDLGLLGIDDAILVIIALILGIISVLAILDALKINPLASTATKQIWEAEEQEDREVATYLTDRTRQRKALPLETAPELFVEFDNETARIVQAIREKWRKFRMDKINEIEGFWESIIGGIGKYLVIGGVILGGIIFLPQIISGIKSIFAPKSA